MAGGNLVVGLEGNIDAVPLDLTVSVLGGQTGKTITDWTTPGGHRLYTQDDVDRLSFIQRAKWVGFTLKEIRTLMRVREADPTESCEDAMELARHKVGEINAKLDELQKMRDALQTFLDTCPDTDAGHCHVIQGLQSVEPPACCD